MKAVVEVKLEKKVAKYADLLIVPPNIFFLEIIGFSCSPKSTFVRTVSRNVCACLGAMRRLFFRVIRNSEFWIPCPHTRADSRLAV